MKIALVGYMTSGKSTVSRLLANDLQLPSLDLDKEIEKDQQMSIPAIFRERGEVNFRKLEHAQLIELLEYKDFVLATGGGTPLYYDNMKRLMNDCQTFYLQASAAFLTKRITQEKESRPLVAHLQEAEIQEFVSKHLFEREPIYRQATYSISIEDKSTQAIVEEIKNHLTLPQ